MISKYSCIIRYIFHFMMQWNIFRLMGQTTINKSKTSNIPISWLEVYRHHLIEISWENWHSLFAENLFQSVV